MITKTISPGCLRAKAEPCSSGAAEPPRGLRLPAEAAAHRRSTAGALCSAPALGAALPLVWPLSRSSWSSWAGSSASSSGSPRPRCRRTVACCDFFVTTVSISYSVCSGLSLCTRLRCDCDGCDERAVHLLSQSSLVDTSCSCCIPLSVRG